MIQAACRAMLEQLASQQAQTAGRHEIGASARTSPMATPADGPERV
jgi:hypothetical protein